MEQARPDSTMLPATQIEAGQVYDSSHDAGARITRLLTTGSSTPLPAPGSEEAKAAFKAACHEHSIRTQFANQYPELKRTQLEWWTAHSLGKALETGELTPAECARLYPLATERELRMAQIEHELNLGSLFALAFADDYPVKGPEPEANEVQHDSGADAQLLQLGCQFEAARQQEIAAIEACTAAPCEDDELEAAASTAGDAAAVLAQGIANLPALTAEGFRVKLRALSHYRRSTLLSEIPDLPDPDQLLAHSLWRDVQTEVSASDDQDLAGIETVARIDFGAETEARGA